MKEIALTDAEEAALRRFLKDEQGDEVKKNSHSPENALKPPEGLVPASPTNNATIKEEPSLLNPSVPTFKLPLAPTKLSSQLEATASSRTNGRDPFSASFMELSSLTTKANSVKCNDRQSAKNLPSSSV